MSVCQREREIQCQDYILKSPPPNIHVHTHPHVPNFFLNKLASAFHSLCLLAQGFTRPLMQVWGAELLRGIPRGKPRTWGAFWWRYQRLDMRDLPCQTCHYPELLGGCLWDPPCGRALPRWVSSSPVQLPHQNILPALLGGMHIEPRSVAVSVGPQKCQVLKLKAF